MNTQYCPRHPHGEWPSCFECQRARSFARKLWDLLFRNVGRGSQKAIIAFWDGTNSVSTTQTNPTNLAARINSDLGPSDRQH